MTVSASPPPTSLPRYPLSSAPFLPLLPCHPLPATLSRQPFPASRFLPPFPASLSHLPHLSRHLFPPPFPAPLSRHSFPPPLSRHLFPPPLFRQPLSRAPGSPGPPLACRTTMANPPRGCLASPPEGAGGDWVQLVANAVLWWLVCCVVVTVLWRLPCCDCRVVAAVSLFTVSWLSCCRCVVHYYELCCALLRLKDD